MRLRFNWLGLAGGIATIVMVAVTLFYPWWQLRVGEGLLTANVSPLNTNFSVLGTAFAVPLVWAINLTSMFTFLMVGVVMVVYSVFPAKSYSKQLLDFAYKKPLYMLVMFVIVLFVFTLVAQVVVRFDVPFVGSVNSVLRVPFVQNTTASVVISAEFLWPFWLAVAAAVLCVAARVYHRRFAVVPRLDVAPVVSQPAAPQAETGV